MSLKIKVHGQKTEFKKLFGTTKFGKFCLNMQNLVLVTLRVKPDSRKLVFSRSFEISIKCVILTKLLLFLFETGKASDLCLLQL